MPCPGRSHFSAIACTPILAVALVIPAAGWGANLALSPESSFEEAVERLQPGDTLTVHAGTYSDRGRISVVVQGTSSAPVLIRGAQGEPRPRITRPADSNPQNTINIEGATYLTISGLEITGNGDGINLRGAVHHVAIQDCDIHHVDVGIGIHGSAHHLLVRGNEIHDTGADGETGEGLYVGCHDGSCAVSQSIFERNLIHDSLHASQGDGIEIKAGSWGNLVRDNVIFNTHYPGILLYETRGGAPNVIERNALWNCGDSGIQAAADATIRNNIILDCPGNGFNSQDHGGIRPSHIVFVNNTIVGGSPALRLSDWAGRPGMIFANNAVYASSSSDFAVGSLRGVTMAGNVIHPRTAALTGGCVAGRSVARDFIAAPSRNVYPAPQSKLIHAGAPAVYAPRDDFNGLPRRGKPDAGAYAWTQATNPGWRVQPGFKSLATKGIGSPSAARSALAR